MASSVELRVASAVQRVLITMKKCKFKLGYRTEFDQVVDAEAEVVVEKSSPQRVATGENDERRGGGEYIEDENNLQLRDGIMSL